MRRKASSLPARHSVTSVAPGEDVARSGLGPAAPATAAAVVSRPGRASTRARQLGKRFSGCLARARAPPRRVIQVAQGELGDARACAAPPAGEAVFPGKGSVPVNTTDDGQAVLIAVNRDLVFEQFGRGIGGREPAQQRVGMVPQILDQSEVGHLHSTADDQEILGLDVEVLERVPLRHVVQGVGRIAQIDEQLVAPDTRPAVAAAGFVAILEAFVGQFGDDHQLAVDDLDPFEGEQGRDAAPP